MAAISSAVAAVASVAGAALSANSQSRAANRAAGAVESANREATQLQRDIYYDQRNLAVPNITAGAGARARQMLMEGYTRDEVKAYLKSMDAATARPSSSYTEGELRTMYPAIRRLIWDGLENDGINGNAAAARNQYGDFSGYVRAQNLAPSQSGDGGSTTGEDPYSWVDDWSYQSSSPSYQFRLDEGTKALERSAAAGGRLFSGATGKALTRYGQKFASQEFENDWGRLGDLSGAGDSSTTQVIGAAGDYGAGAAAGIRNAGDARASAYGASGNAWGDFWSGAGGYVSGFGSRHSTSGDNARRNGGWWGG